MGVAGFFILTGLEKFSTGGPGASWVTIFNEIGLGQWFRNFTGAVEIVGGMLYVLPKTCALGATLLASTMVGAIFVHVAILHSYGASAVPATLLFAVVAIAMREPEELLTPRSQL